MISDALVYQHRFVIQRLQHVGLCALVGSSPASPLIFCMLPLGHEDPVHGHPGEPGYYAD